MPDLVLTSILADFTRLVDALTPLLVLLLGIVVGAYIFEILIDRSVTL